MQTWESHKPGKPLFVSTGASCPSPPASARCGECNPVRVVFLYFRFRVKLKIFPLSLYTLGLKLSSDTQTNKHTTRTTVLRRRQCDCHFALWAVWAKGDYAVRLLGGRVKCLCSKSVLLCPVLCSKSRAGACGRHRLSTLGRILTETASMEGGVASWSSIAFEDRHQNSL